MPGDMGLASTDEPLGVSLAAMLDYDESLSNSVNGGVNLRKGIQFILQTGLVKHGVGDVPCPTREPHVAPFFQRDVKASG